MDWRELRLPVAATAAAHRRGYRSRSTKKETLQLFLTVVPRMDVEDHWNKR